MGGLVQYSNLDAIYGFYSNFLTPLLQDGQLGSTPVFWGFCSNVAPSDLAHILHTGVFEGEECNKNGSRHGSLPVQKLLTISIA